jgi:hypothetical protein
VTPLERAARALYDARAKRNHPRPELHPWEDASHLERRCLMIDARAVLQAIREPTARMVVAGAKQQDNGDGYLHRRKWMAMIDAALEEG